jgi:hypothetical protein
MRLLDPAKLCGSTPSWLEPTSTFAPPSSRRELCETRRIKDASSHRFAVLSRRASSAENLCSRCGYASVRFEGALRALKRIRTRAAENAVKY